MCSCHLATVTLFKPMLTATTESTLHALLGYPNLTFPFVTGSTKSKIRKYFTIYFRITVAKLQTWESSPEQI